MENIIEVMNYRFSYQSHAVIKNLNMNVKTGSITTLVGNTGGGKTTLVKLIAGLLNGEGEIKILGNPIAFRDVTYLKEIGVVLGNPFDNFVARTVVEDLVFPLENLQMKKEEIEKYLDDIVQYFHIESLLELDPMELTCEDAAIVALASALVTKPRVLILDDAFAKIGAFKKKKIMRILKDMNRRFHLTILNVTHDINEVMNGTDAILLYNGEIVLSGPVLEFIENEKELKKYHYELPKIVDLSNRLRYYNVIDHTILDMNRMVNTIWK